MDSKEDYQDPDYPATVTTENEEPLTLSEEEKLSKTKAIIRREFANELQVRENEIVIIDQRMMRARRLLHRLRYTLVNNYYNNQKLQLSNSQIQDEVAAQLEPRARSEVSELLRDNQRRIHPSLRKLLGKQTVDLDEIFRSRSPRNKIRKNYHAMIQSRNYTICADKTKSLRPETDTYIKQEEPSSSRPKKIPRHIEPKIENVLTLDEITRNKMKHRFRIIIGNTSKYVPPASRADRSTHKWLLYVRGPPDQPDIGAVVTAVTARLHHSYAPHHTVHIDKPPYHISRRGWGEFPAKLELHFALPERNRPASVEHTIKLDRNYTGLQTLGAETVVDVWLYSTPEMLKYEYKEEETPKDTQESVELPEIKLEYNTDILDNNYDSSDNWMDFLTLEKTELNVDEMIIKPEQKVIKEEKNDFEDYIANNIISKNNTNQECNDTENNYSTYTHINNSENFNGQNDDIQTNFNADWSLNNYNKIQESFNESIPEEILNQNISPKKRIMKYMDPATGKIFYLEMDRNLDLSKVQEIVIDNSKGSVKTAKISPIKTNTNGLKDTKKNKGVSLLKPEVKNSLKTDNENVKKPNQLKTCMVKSVSHPHIENDHCYLGISWKNNISSSPSINETNLAFDKINSKNNVINNFIRKEKTLHYDRLCEAVENFTCVRMAVNYLLQKMPLITDEARDPNYLSKFPFVVVNHDKYWKLDFAKRRNIEWSRAKLINTILTKHFKYRDQPIWRTKQILVFSRLHGYYPIREDALQRQSESADEWSSWNDLENSRQIESNIKEIYPKASDISTLTIFGNEHLNCSDIEVINLTESDQEIDIVSCEFPIKVKKEVLPETCSAISMLPVDSEEDRLRFMYIEKKCADIGIELRNEDIGHGYSYSAVHAVLLSAVRNFAEELIRNALAVKLNETRSSSFGSRVWVGSSSSRSVVSLEHMYRGITGRLQVLTAAGTATEKKKAGPV